MFLMGNVGVGIMLQGGFFLVKLMNIWFRHFKIFSFIRDNIGNFRKLSECINILLGRSATLYPFIIIQIKLFQLLQIQLLQSLLTIITLLIDNQSGSMSVGPVSGISLLGDFIVPKLLYSFFTNFCLVLITFSYYKKYAELRI